MIGPMMVGLDGREVSSTNVDAGTELFPPLATVELAQGDVVDVTLMSTTPEVLEQIGHALSSTARELREARTRWDGRRTTTAGGGR